MKKYLFLLVICLLSCQQSTTTKTYFTLSEFNCKSGETMPNSVKNTIQSELMPKLTLIRVKVMFPMNVVSGYRSPQYNAVIGGVVNSEHCFGYASDISIHSAVERYLIVKYAMFYDAPRLGLYTIFIHIGVSKTGYPTQVVWLGSQDL